MIMATKSVQDRFNQQRRALGLPELDYDLLASELNQLPAELLDAEASGEPLEFGVEEEQADEEAVVSVLGGTEPTGSRQEQFQQRVDQALSNNWEQAR